MVVVSVHFGKYNRRKVSKEDHICLSCVGVKIVNLDINIVMLLLYTLYLNCLKTRNIYHCFVHIVESVLFIVNRNWSLFFFLTRLDVKASKENAYAILLKSYSKLSLKYLYNFFRLSFLCYILRVLNALWQKFRIRVQIFIFLKDMECKPLFLKKWQKKCSILNRSTF